MRNAASLLMLALLIGAGFAANAWLTREMREPGPDATAVRIDIEPGSTVRAVLLKLGASGVLDSPRAVETYLRFHARQPQIKAGRYEIPPRATPEQILRLLESGAVVLEQLTVVEGTTFAQFRRTLEQHPAVRAILRGKSDAQVMIAIGHAAEPPEGRFFPDTYRFAAHTTDVEILKLAYARMQRLLDEAWQSRSADLPIRTSTEALILASLIEKETAQPAERREIAGVFIARLRLGMRLQSDPTVIYGLGEQYDGDIRTRDLTTDTPYNTYTRSGLPPTPIALPGRESVLAAVHPTETGALYFVATGDGSGAHHFSKTLEEHNEAVKRYLARLRQGSSKPAGGS